MPYPSRLIHEGLVPAIGQLVGHLGNVLEDANLVLKDLHSRRNVDYYFVFGKIVLRVVHGLHDEKQFVHRVDGPEIRETMWA